MKKRTIYTNQSQELLRLFEQAANSSKVMCVPIDYAKRDHVVMFCNGYGDIVRKPFSVKNSPEGLKYLIDQVTRSCRLRHIKKHHVFFGGEDVNSYAENFASALRSQGWLIAHVNARDAKKQRQNLQASTDRLDLMGIATMLLSRRANCSAAQTGIYRNLRTLVRHRKKLVVMKTEVRNRVHAVVDRLFPGFLNEKKSGITPFSNSSLYLMENSFSAQQIRRRKRSTLCNTLKRYGTADPEATAGKLQSYAAQVLTTQNQYAATLQISLAHHIKLYRCLLDNTEQLEKEIALPLAQSQGAFLTSIKGIGIVLAAGVTAEIGSPFKQRPLNNLTSYSGIIPRVKQSGGPNAQTHTGRVSKRSNHLLKDSVVQSAFHIGHFGPKELSSDYKRRKGAGQHADFGMGRRFLRMAMSLMKTSQIYLPTPLRNDQVRAQERAGYYLSVWPQLRDKWNKVDALKVAFAKHNPLGQWRHMVQEFYRIKLKL
jgi:transposase